MIYGYLRVSTDKQTLENQRYDINNKVIIPDDEEQERNPRSRSAKLRIAEKR